MRLTRSVCPWWGLVGFSAVCSLAACNQIFGIPSVTQGNPAQGVDGGVGDGAPGDGGSTDLSLDLLAGNIGGIGNADGSGANARFSFPSAVAVDSAGNLYVADTSNDTIRKITASGTVTTLAGVAGVAGSADGTGPAARFNTPTGIAVDSNGFVYVADSHNSTIRTISPGGTVATLAGSAGQTGSTDSMGTAARFNSPFGVAVDGNGIVFVADQNNHTIRRITSDGTVTTLAGSPGASGSLNGTGSQARFSFPSDVAVDGNGNVYVADQNNALIRKITSGGLVTTLAGGAPGSADGTGPAARFSGPTGVAADGAGNVYVADLFNSTIRKVTSAGVVTTLAGTPLLAGNIDDTGAAARFNFPSGVAVDSAGNVFVADQGNSSIRKITPAKVVTTPIGAGSAPGNANGTGTAASFNQVAGVAVDLVGNVFVADESNSSVRKITPAGLVTTQATSMEFASPTGIALDGAGNIYTADQNNNVLFKIIPGVSITPLAGGAGSTVQLNNPTGVATDSTGNIYIADTNSSVIRKVTPAGVVTVLAGSTPGSMNGNGTAAQFAFPVGVAVDGTNNVYVADTNNNTIRKITPAGDVTTLAGSPGSPGSADGTGAAARFHTPTSVTVDGTGNIFAVDQSNFTIRKITPAGVVTTVAGKVGVAGILLGAAPRFGAPQYLAISGDSLVISDTNAILILRHGAR